VKQYAEIAAEPIQQQRRDLWRAHQSLKPTRPPILANFGMWNVWCKEVFGPQTLECEDAFFRAYEQTLRMWLFRAEVADDCIAEPWLTVSATQRGGALGDGGRSFQGHPPADPDLG